MKDKNQELKSISQKWSGADFITFIPVGCLCLSHINIHSLVTYPQESQFIVGAIWQGGGGDGQRHCVLRHNLSGKDKFCMVSHTCGT